MAQCNNCKSLVSDDDKFCQTCGKSLINTNPQIKCQGCDATILDGNYCPHCGISRPSEPLRTNDCPRSPNRRCSEDEKHINGQIVCKYCQKVLGAAKPYEGREGGGTY